MRPKILKMNFSARGGSYILNLAAGMAALLFCPEPSAAQGKLEAHYRATLSGLPIGSGAWTVDFTDDHYTMAASGQASGLLRIFASGEGAAAVKGALHGGKLSPASFAVAVRTRNKVNQVNMALVGGAVKEVSIEPPVEPAHDLVPLTDAHKRGVLDPISAGIIPRAGSGVGPEVCQRTHPIFDGRMRFDLALSFKRMETVQTERGYAGPAVVCAVIYKPIGGYEKERYAIKYLRENRDMELWFAPVNGTRFLAVYRISLPTALGPAVLQATRFQSTPQPTRTGAAKPPTQ